MGGFTVTATRLLLALSLLLLISCTRSYSPLELHAPSGESTEFPGIASIVRAAPEHTVDVLLTHGMCTQDEDWGTDTLEDFRAMLGAKAAGPLWVLDVPGTQVRLYQQTLEFAGGLVRANALEWWRVTAPLKQALCYDQTGKADGCVHSPAYPYKRAGLNATLKDELIGDCLSDALIYAGKSRSFISAQIWAGVLQAMDRTGGRKAADNTLQRLAAEQAPTVIFTESQSSKMFFDALHDALSSDDPDERAAARTLFLRLQLVVMKANQLPLLGLADNDLGAAKGVRSAEAEFAQDPVSVLMRETGSTSSADKGPVILNVTDPNDLLSYTTPPEDPKPLHQQIDVIVSNAPAVFGVLARPDAVHEGYDDNKDLQHLLVCGNPVNNCEPSWLR